jgi:hypothetical protein
LTPAVVFLRRYAGPSSLFAQQATKLIEEPYVAWRWPHAMADLLDDWAAFYESGMEAQAPFEVQARMEAASDLMEQVQSFLDVLQGASRRPVVLAGAALEELLRGLQSTISEP